MVRAKKRYKVLVLFDTAGTPPPDQDFTKELKTDDWAAEAHVIGALKKLGHEVRTVGVWDEPGMIIDEIKTNPPDVVFNLTEHFNEVSAYDRNVAGLLEMMDVPYTGSSPTGLTLCKNKGMAKELLAYHNIRVPNFAIFSPGSSIKRPKRLKFPLFIKPLKEEGSVGISLDSFVDNDVAFEERIRFIHERLNQEALAEEYIEGTGTLRQYSRHRSSTRLSLPRSDLCRSSRRSAEVLDLQSKVGRRLSETVGNPKCLCRTASERHGSAHRENLPRGLPGFTNSRLRPDRSPGHTGGRDRDPGSQPESKSRPQG